MSSSSSPPPSPPSFSSSTASPPGETASNSPPRSPPSSASARPQLHIETNPVPRRPSLSILTTPPRSRDGRRSSFNENNPPASATPSFRSQRSDVPRVRFSSDVQTLGERTVVSPSITADEALSRLQHSSSQSSLNRRPGSAVSNLPYVPVVSPHDHPIRGILRSPTQTPATLHASAPQQPPGRQTRPRGWSLRRQLFSKQDSPPVSPYTIPTAGIGLTTFPPPQNAPPLSQPQLSRSIDGVDAIRVVHAALDQARIDPPIASIQPKSSSTKKLPIIEPEVTQASLPFYSTWATSHRTRHMLADRFKGIMRKIKLLRDPRLLSKGKGREIPIDVEGRGKTHLLDERTGREYVDNLITSSRYTIYSFLPRQIWAQFSKIANLYQP
jgi:phospholipid-translocating ATPase